MKKATAETSLEVWVHCPNCERYLDKTKTLREHLQDDLRAKDIDVEVSCYVCGEIFIVTDISY
jgi:RNase P subunit RPR2